MGKPILFISHSTNGLPSDDRSVKLRECLCSALSREDKKERTWHVFIDSSINPGAKWRMEILYHLAGAHAGIVLFNEKAVSKSSWVMAEALILCFRKFIDPNFQVIPVLLDGRCLEDTCFKKCEPFQLAEIQYIKDNKLLSPEDLANHILSYLDPNRAKRSPMSPWVHRVVDLLRKVDIIVLQEAAEQLDLESPNEAELWNRLGDSKEHCLCKSIAELMHHKPILESLGAFKRLSGSFSNEDINILRKYLTAKWVTNDAMEVILGASRNPKKNGLILVNARAQAIIEEYLNRSKIEIDHNDSALWAFSVSSGAGEDDNAIKYQIEKTIQDTIIVPLDDEDYEMAHLPQAVEERLNKPDDVAICALPHEYAKEQILNELRQLYPKIIFLVQVGNSVENLKLFNTIKAISLPPLDNGKRNELSNLKSRLRAAISQNLRDM